MSNINSNEAAESDFRGNVNKNKRERDHFVRVSSKQIFPKSQNLKCTRYILLLINLF